MIKKLTDFESGVSSPLLPLMYTDFLFNQNSLDGAFLQLSEDGELQAVFSLKNTCITLSLVSEDGIDELQSFFEFSAVTAITSDKPLNKFCNSSNAYSLYDFSGNISGESNCRKLSLNSDMKEYQDIYSLVSENKEGFENWFVEFSKKINSQSAMASYIKSGEEAVSCSVVNAIYKNTAIISGVFTLPEYRRKGYATQCVKNSVISLLQKQINRITLWCSAENENFYEKIGFKKIGKIYVGECK